MRSKLMRISITLKLCSNMYSFIETSYRNYNFHNKANFATEFAVGLFLYFIKFEIFMFIFLKKMKSI